MPAKSEKQRRLMAIALKIKRGEASCSQYPTACKIAKQMTEEQLREFAMKSKKKRK